MWPFKSRRKQDKDSVPQEIQEYYESERRERVGIAWLLALATLVITVLLAVVLFFGGRWIYRAIIGTEDRAPDTVQQEENGVDNEEEPDEPEDTEMPLQTTPPTTLPGDDTDLPRTGPEDELY